MIPIVGVMGSGSEPHEELASRLASEIARLDACLLVGGGGGVMSSVARHFKQVKPAGLVIGILPSRAAGSGKPPPGYPNQWIDIAIQTHLHLSGELGVDPMSRNHVNVLSSSAVVALPGGAGTASEVCLAHGYAKPVIVFHGNERPLASVPKEVKQTAEIAEVARFLKQHVG